GRHSAADLAAPCAAIGAAEAHRGAIVMDLLKLQAEGLADRQDHICEQGRAIGIEQVVERAPQAVIAEVLHLRGGDAEHTGGEAIHCLLLPVDWLSFDNDRAQQHAECASVRHGAALIGGHVSNESIVQSHTHNEMIDDGQWAEALDQQRRANHLACVSAREGESQESCHADEKISSCRRASASTAFARSSTPWTTSVRELFSVE